jgi:hypothetical protein
VSFWISPVLRPSRYICRARSAASGMSVMLCSPHCECAQRSPRANRPRRSLDARVENMKTLAEQGHAVKDYFPYRAGMETSRQVHAGRARNDRAAR